MTAKYDFAPINKGDTFSETKLEVFVDGIPMDLTGGSVRLLILSNNKILFEVPTEITNTIGGEITIKQWDVHLYPYIYDYQFKITSGAGKTLTYLEGDFPVLK